MSSERSSSFTHCSCFDVFSTTNNICKFYYSNFQRVSIHAFFSWENVLTQEWICSCPSNLSKCTEKPSGLSTKTSIERNPDLSWINRLLTSFRLKMNFRSFSKHQKKTSDTDRHKGYFLTARVSQVNVITMKRIFEQFSDLQVSKCVIVHVLSSSFNVSSFEPSKEKKAAQHLRLRVANEIVLNQVRLHHERDRECMRTTS